MECKVYMRLHPALAGRAGFLAKSLLAACASTHSRLEINDITYTYTINDEIDKK